MQNGNGEKRKILRFWPNFFSFLFSFYFEPNFGIDATLRNLSCLSLSFILSLSWFSFLSVHLSNLRTHISWFSQSFFLSGFFLSSVLASIHFFLLVYQMSPLSISNIFHLFLSLLSLFDLSLFLVLTCLQLRFMHLIPFIW